MVDRRARRIGRQFGLAVVACSVGAMLLLAQPATASGTATTAGAVSGGLGHTCVLTGAGAVECRGNNSVGQLGDGTHTGSLTPVAVSGLSSGVVALSAGYTFSCAVTSAGAAECWGHNGNSQLGDGTTTDSSTPVQVSGLSSGVVAINAAGFHTCALTSGGGAKCWGWNGEGELGDGTTDNRSTPVDVSGLASGVVAISAGDEHTCAVMSGGAVKCWGYNGDGELGDGTTTDSSTPVQVSGLSSGVVAVRAARYHTCALTSAGAVKCWGSNASGQLGDGTTTDSTTPVDVSGLASGVVALGGGVDHTCALTSAGAVKCWGYNGDGELGDGTTTDRSTPVQVGGLSGTVVAIGAGFGHSCALTSRGALECWGRNDSGQLGDGTTTDRSTPVFASGYAERPSASIAAPAPDGVYRLGEVVATSFSCSEGLAGSGLASCDDTNGITTESGGSGQLDTSTLGEHSYTVTASSSDGLSDSATISYTVAPANDDFADRITLPGRSGSRSGDTNVGATMEPGEPNPGEVEGATVWYRWTAPASGVVIITTAGSGFDTVLAAYSGNALGALTLLDFNDDAGGHATSRIGFEATAGTEYQIAVGGYAGASAIQTGTVELHWAFGSGTAPPPPAPPPPPPPPPAAGPPPPPPPAPPAPPAPAAKKQCLVPNVKGRLLLVASRMLTSHGCRVGKVTRAHSRTRRRGLVISQSRRAGRVLAQGTKVNLVVSRGRGHRR